MRPAFKRRLLALGAAGICLSACFVACLADPKDGPRPIVPLAVGNAWSYAETTFVSGQLTEARTSEAAILAKKTLPNGKVVFVFNVKNRFTGEPGAYSTYLNNKGASNYVQGVEGNGDTVYHETLHVKWPARTGERYAYLQPRIADSAGTAVLALDTLEVEVVNADSVCAMPAGNFACMHLRVYNPDGSVYADTYYAPGVGQLGSDIRRATGARGDTLDALNVKRLTSFNLN